MRPWAEVALRRPALTGPRIGALILVLEFAQGECELQS